MTNTLCPATLAKVGFLALFLLAASAIVYGRKGENAEPVALLKDAARLFKHLSRRSENTIPDAVLNRTTCVVVIPGGAGGTDRHRGVVSCRETSDRWNTPTFITFKEDGVRAHRAELLVLILQDAGVRALRSGRLRIRPQRHVVPPLVRTTPVPSQVELTAELLVYEYAADVLSGSRAGGVIGAEADKNPHVKDPVGGEVPDKITKQYLSSVESFFNTILPTGIVVHHTAIIPSENALPRSERDVDKYHQARGFEIRCSGRVYHAAYHYVILPNGRVQTGRPERCEGAHAQGYNSYLGISVVGDFSSEDNPTGKKGPTKPSEKQIASLVKLCRRLKDRYNIPLHHIIRHSDISRTRCPGDRFPFSSVLQQLQATQPSGTKSESR